MSTLAILFNIILEVPARVIRQEKIVKSIQIGNKEVKSFLFTNDMTLCVETKRFYNDHQNSYYSRKMNSQKFAGYKIKS